MSVSPHLARAHVKRMRDDLSVLEAGMPAAGSTRRRSRPGVGRRPVDHAPILPRLTLGSDGATHVQAVSLRGSVEAVHDDGVPTQAWVIAAE